MILDCSFYEFCESFKFLSQTCRLFPQRRFNQAVTLVGSSCVPRKRFYCSPCNLSWRRVILFGPDVKEECRMRRRKEETEKLLNLQSSDN